MARLPDFQFVDLMLRRWGGVATVTIHTDDLERIFDIAKHPADLRPQGIPPGLYTIDGQLLDELLQNAHDNILSATAIRTQDDEAAKT